jgi:hypothetical protein
VVVSITVAEFATMRETLDDPIYATLESADTRWGVLSQRFMNNNSSLAFPKLCPETTRVSHYEPQASRSEGWSGADISGARFPAQPR